jgi:hypothetical protein
MASKTTNQKQVNRKTGKQVNTTKGERDAMRKLQKNKDVTILPADKGQATVLIPRLDYGDKMTEILVDTTTYRKLTGDPTSKHKKKLGYFLLHKVKNKGYMGDREYYRTRPATDLAPGMIANLKLHKESKPLRPIVAGRTSISQGYPKS